MNLTVNGKGIDVGEALRTHVSESLDRVFEKYFSNPIEATATFSKQGYRFSAQISVHVGRGILMQAEAEAAEVYAAFDTAVENVAKRLRRHKRRLRDYHREPADSYAARQFVLAAEPEEDDDAEPVDGRSESGGAMASGAVAGDRLNGDLCPAVIAEMEAEIPTLTVGEAVMRLDLAETQAMMFHNRAHGGLNMVYRRNDGNIGWVDPALKSAPRADSGSPDRR
jgi:ribosomal subunit interface protein